MKCFKKATAVFCAVAIIICSTMVTAFATDIDYEINNPYAGVNWDTYSQYKADLHSHTTASDGSSTLKEMTEAHYANGFEIVAVTDHGSTDRGWTTVNYIPALRFFVKLFKKGRSETIDVLSAAGEAANGNSYSYVNENGGDYYYQTDTLGQTGQKMMRVPYGIENNPSSLNNAHVNSWFVEYGDGRLGGTSDYVTPISGVDALGGLCIINHPGEYTNARDELFTSEAYSRDSKIYDYKIRKFETMLLKYPACLGIDVNSKGDSRTRFDRKLWDIMLQDVVPHGRSVYAFATSDAHSTSAVYTGYTMMCMESNTVENLRECMENGAFFAASKCLGNYDEIGEIAGILTENGDSSGMAETMTKIYNDGTAALANGDNNPKYEAPAEVDAPLVTRVTVDDTEDTISLSTTRDALVIRWIANGETIATGSTIDLDDYSGKIGSYVRAEIFGKGGIVYTQAFTLNYDGAPEAKEINFVDYGFLASVVPDNIVRFIGAIPIFDALLKIMDK